MIDQEKYLKSLAKLEEKEKAKQQAVENGKKFLEEYKKSLETSKKEHKKIFLLFYMEGCDGCNVIKYIIDNNKQVQNYLDKYIVVTCNISKTYTNLAQKYNLYSYPAYFIIDGNEKKLKEKIGVTIQGGAERNLINWLNAK